MKRIHTFTHSMGHLCVILLLFISFVIGGTGQAWGGNFKAAGEARISGTGGAVCVVQDGDNAQTYLSNLSNYKTTTQTVTLTATSGQVVTFCVGAVSTQRGRKFKEWSNVYREGSFGSVAFVDSYGRYTEQTKIKVTTGSGTAANVAVRFTDITTKGYLTATFIEDPDQVQVTYLSTTGGSYTASGPNGYNTNGTGTITIGDGSTYTTYYGDNITLNATPSEGNNFIRYYTIDASGTLKTLGEPFVANQIVHINNIDDKSGVVSVGVEFSPNPFAIGERTFATLDAAVQAANSSTNKVIKVIKSTTVGEGDYTLPTGITLWIPYSSSQDSPKGNNLERFNVTTAATSAYRVLTFAEGAHLLVHGTIEVGGKQAAGAQGATGTGIPTGTYGQIELNSGSKITLNNGAILYAYGFVTGAGEIDARRGSKVYEQFQMYDWKGGSLATPMITSGKKVFPITQYFIQNVEASTTYHPGAELIGRTSIPIDEFIVNCNNVKIIGSLNSGAMFLMDEADMSENTWVRKSYDAATDRQVYDVNSSAHLGSMIITFDLTFLQSNLVARGILWAMGITGNSLDFDSRDYVLPVTNNLKIHLLSGDLGITQSSVLLPGSEIEIDKTATVHINSNQSLYLYDKAEWGEYIFKNPGMAYASRIKHRPGQTPTETQRSITDLNKIGSASINVHGTFDVQGNIYTTASGANIFSTIADAGTVRFSHNAPTTNSTVYQWHLNSGDAEYIGASCPSALLKNDEGSALGPHSPTAGAQSQQSFCFIDFNKADEGKGEWVSLTSVYDAFLKCYPFVKDQYDNYYAKPADYVALANGMEENADHTYSSADGTRTFILMRDCQWWEVEYDTQSGLYYCDKDKNYYYYDEDDGGWLVKTYTVTWQNWEGSTIVAYEMAHNKTPEYLGNYPTRPDDAGYYTYDFTGWAPAFTPVTADVTYVAQYEKNPVRYTITWQNANGSEREVDYYTRDEWPVCRLAPDMTAWEWMPAVAAVTGNATYRLYARDTEGPFTIKYVNWDWNGQAETVLKSESVAKNGALTPPANPTKTALTDIEFVFAGWKGANNVVYAPNALPVATENITYTAMYNEHPIEYTITWKNYNDDVLFQDEHVAPNAVPQYTGATPTKILEDDYNYMFSGWSPAIVAATSDKEYTAQYIAVPKNRTINAEEAIAASTIQEVTTLTITSTGQLTIPGTSRIDATNLILEATENSSGELFATNTSINATNVYYDLTLDTDRRHWRAFGVPWPVGDLKVTKLVEVKNRTGAECHRELALGRDYDIMYYNGAYRAAHGPGAACWEYVQDHGNTLTPGQGYMIAFTSEVGTIRFTKAAEANVVYNSTSLPIVENTGDPTNPDANWNGIANPMTYHTLLDAGTTLLVQVHDGGEIGHDGYKNAPADGKYVVGKMVYFQAPTAQSTVAISKAGSEAVITPYAAPARREAEREVTLNDFYHVELLNIEGVKNADVFIRAEEDKPDTYYIGKDVACMGLTSARAQMWVNRYNVKLCMNTTAPINDVAEYAISVYAPSNGEYTIRLNHQPEEDYTLYLTRDGEAIWDLSMGDYVTDLTSGVHKEFGLRLSANKAPEVATGMDEAVVDAKGETRKVIIDNNVYIIRGGEVYTMTGAKIQ